MPERCSYAAAGVRRAITNVPADSRSNSITPRPQVETAGIGAIGGKSGSGPAVSVSGSWPRFSISSISSVGIQGKKIPVQRKHRCETIDSGIDKESFYGPSRIGSLAARTKDRRSD